MSSKKVAGASTSKKSQTREQDAPTSLMPKLRFPEFREAKGWEETQLQKIARPVADRAVTGDGDNILSLSNEHGIVLQSDYFGKKIAGDSAERYLKLLRNDFVYNDRTTKASTFGTIKRLSKYDGGIVSPIYKCFRFHADENPVFWEWYFESGSHDAVLGGLVNEGARAGRFNISISQFLSTAAWRPDEPEQQKIAECVSSVDELMAVQARKVDALKTHKKGLMQQLFPREGEAQPLLRFPEFQNAGEWVEKTFGEIVAVASGQVDPTKPPYCDFPQIGSENIESNTGKLVNVKSAGDKGVISGNYVFDENDVLYSKIRPALNKVAAPAFKGICSADIYPIRPANGGLHRSYLMYLLLSQKFLEYAIRNSERGKIPKINRDGLLTYAVLIPSVAEQKRIASCITTLDDLIAAQTHKHEALKTHKKGLMQQLFPGSADVPVGRGNHPNDAEVDGE